MQETISLTLKWKRFSIATSLSLSFMTGFEWKEEFYCYPVKKKKEILSGSGGGCHWMLQHFFSLLWARGNKFNFQNSPPRHLAKGFPYCWAAMLRSPWLGKQYQELCCYFPSLPSTPSSPSSFLDSCGEMLLLLGSHRQAHHSNLCAHQTHSHINKEFTLI